MPPEDVERLLLQAEVEGEELLPQGSNYTFALQLRSDDLRFIGIYKPLKGERPLWDFPYGTLHKRERCSYLVSQALGWGLVPPTVIREGPQGEGSVQLYIPHDGSSNYFTLREERRPELPFIAAFDLMINNTDRKGGHCFRGEDDRVWGIDHGLTFHVEPKLRTVIWDFSGYRLPPERVEDIRRLGAALSEPETPLSQELNDLLDPQEVEVFQWRVKAFLDDPVLPGPEEYIRLPWPPL